MYLDAHCHLDFPVFDADRDAVLKRARDAGITRFVVAGVRPEDWQRQRRLAAEVEGVRWTAGLHPVPAAAGADLDAALAALPAAFEGEHPACAVGEIGLDSVFAEKSTLDAQVTAFRAQLDYARTENRPVVLHIVGAHGRAADLLTADGVPDAGGMVHACSASAEMVKRYVALGLHIGFAGPVARPDARKLHAAVRATPADRLLLETDAPDQSPPGGPSRNEPAQLLRVAEAVARLRGEEPEQVLRRTSTIATALFWLE